MTREIFLADAAATERLGAQLAGLLPAGAVVYLRGDLGAGKTTLVRGLLHALGHVGAVKSPTYTLVEPYTVGDRRLYHFDLYRLSDPEELELMGGRDYFDGGAIALVEWPERGVGYLPAPMLEIELVYAREREVEGRRVVLAARGSAGEQVLTAVVEPPRP